MRLALDRGRAGDSKAAPHADSGVTSTAAAAEKRDGEDAATAGSAASKESRSGDDASSSVRFRQELEVPAPRDVGVRTASPRANAAGGSGAGGWRTPAKAQRLPPSHRRPKTPHIDGAASAAAARHPTGTSKVSALAGEGGRRAEDTGGLATTMGGGEAVLSPTHANARRTIQRDQLGGSGGGGGGGGGRAQAATPGPQRSRSERSLGNKSSDQRKVLVPVQLGEVEERTRPSALRGLPPPPSPRRLAPRTFGGKTGSSPRSRPVAGGQAHNESARGGFAGTKCPPSPSAAAGHSSARGFGTKRQAADGNRGLRRKNSATALLRSNADSAGEAAVAVEDTPSRRKTGTTTTPSRSSSETDASTAKFAVAAAAAPSTRTVEVAHLRPPNREASAGGGGGDNSGGRGGGGRDGELPTPRGVHEQGRNAEVPRVSMGDDETELLDSKEMAIDSAAAAAATVSAAPSPAAESERGSAAELAVHLISAHREDVRSALAAARRDMDLVSKADQDRQPAALLEYAREVEGVLGARLAAGAKLRAALDSYVALRQASSRPGQEEPILPEGRARGVRTVQA